MDDTATEIPFESYPQSICLKNKLLILRSHHIRTTIPVEQTFLLIRHGIGQSQKNIFANHCIHLKRKNKSQSYMVIREKIFLTHARFHQDENGE